MRAGAACFPLLAAGAADDVRCCAAAPAAGAACWHLRSSPTRAAPSCPARYELHSELGEALEHASDRGRNTKILLKVTDVGEQYE